MIVPTDQDRALTDARKDLVTIDNDAAASALEHVLATGDLAQLSAKQRIGYYLHICNRLGLASESRPFDWLTLDGRLVLYPNKSCAEQLRRQHQISVKLVRKDRVGDLFVVEVEGTRPNGQSDFASKYVPLRNARGEPLNTRDLVNAYAKAETGAKRRLTLSMIGLGGVPDLEDIEKVRYVVVDAHGNVIEKPTDEQRYLAENPQAARTIGEPTFETEATPEDAPDIAAGPSQAVTPDELERPTRNVPRHPSRAGISASSSPTSFRPSEEEVNHRQGAWFAAVKGTSLDDDDARHRYVADWTRTAGWPKGKQTGSLPIAIARMTEREAESFAAQVRAIVEDERKDYQEALAESNAGHEAVSEADQEPF